MEERKEFKIDFIQGKYWLFRWKKRPYGEGYALCGKYVSFSTAIEKISSLKGNDK